MSLDFEYGINTGNRFLSFVGHEEDPDEYIANQIQPAEKSTKDSKTVTSSKTTKKTTTTKPSSATTTTTAAAVSTAAKTNKENLTGKSSNTDQRRQQTTVLGDSNYQQTRGGSGRGGGRGYGRGGGSAGQDRQPYEGRGGGQQRSQRFNKFEGQPASNESGWNDQGGDTWANETGNENPTFGGGYRGRGRGGGRGRGNYEGGRGGYEGGRGSYEGGRGGGRGRGRGRGGFNRSFEEGSQQQQQQQQTGDWEQTDSNAESTRPQTGQPSGQEMDADVAPQERSFEQGNQRGGRGQFRSRTFHNNRNYGSGRQNQYDREGGDQEESRQSRRQHDRQPRSYVSGVKPIEKRGGEGAHNWGSQTENPEEVLATEEQVEATGETAAPVSKDWSQQVDEAEKQMTLDEYKKQIEAKKRAQQEKLPQFTPRVANEGVDPKQFKDFAQEYRKKNEGEESEEEVEDEDEENEEEEENDDEQQASGKKKVINIPLYFKPIDMPRGGPRRGTGRFRPNRDEQTRSKSPSQQQYSYQQTGEYPTPDQQQQQQQQQQPPQQQQQQQQQQQSRPYRGGSRGQGSGRGEYRRSYGNSNRGSRGGYNRSNANSNTPDLDNTTDFPTLAK